MFLLMLSVPKNTLGQQTNNPILFIYDASGSMWGQLDGKTKKEIAATVLTETVNGLPKDQKIGLIAYGHRREKDCSDIELLSSIDNHSKSKINNAVQNMNALGRTPLARSATRAIELLKESGEKVTIIMVTDGIESCEGNICEVIKSAVASGIDFRLHIVGFGLKEDETTELVCAANAGNGQYFDATNSTELAAVLDEATHRTVDEPEPNFGITVLKDGEMIDAMVRTTGNDPGKRSIGVRTYRDTGFMHLPVGVHDLEVAPLENSQIKSRVISGVRTEADRMTFKSVSFDAIKLNFVTTNNREGWDCTVRIFDQEGKQVGGTRTYGREKTVEIDPGTYDIRIQALNMKGMNTGVEIENVRAEGGIVDVNHNFESGELFILPVVEGEPIDCTTKFIDAGTNEVVGGGRSYTKGVRYHINPGTYRVEVNPLSVHADKGKKVVTVTVGTGEIVEKEVSFN